MNTGVCMQTHMHKVVLLHAFMHVAHHFRFSFQLSTASPSPQICKQCNHHFVWLIVRCLFVYVLFDSAEAWCYSGFELMELGGG